MPHPCDPCLRRTGYHGSKPAGPLKLSSPRFLPQSPESLSPSATSERMMLVNSKLHSAVPRAARLVVCRDPLRRISLVRPGPESVLRRQSVFRQRHRPSGHRRHPQALARRRRAPRPRDQSRPQGGRSTAKKPSTARNEQALQEFLPTITLTGDTGFYQHNLAALGFGPGFIDKLGKLFPGGFHPTSPSSPGTRSPRANSTTTRPSSPAR